MLYEVSKILARKKSRYQSIEIVQTSEYGKMMILDHKIMLTEREEFPYHEMLTHVPMFSIQFPINNVLIIGGGDGGTARECLKHKNISKIDICEIDKLVVDLSRQHLASGKYLNNRKVNIIVDDGMKFLDRISCNTYEVVLVDGTDPVGEGKVLFTKEFFTKVKRVLRPGGVFCLQSETPFTQHGYILSNVKNELSALFKHVRFYGAAVPMYPSGYWLFTIASSKKISFNARYFSQMKHTLQNKYYNEEIHEASFRLPEFFRTRMYGK